MDTFKFRLFGLVLIVLFIGGVAQVCAQRNVSYPELAMKNRQSSVSFDFLTLPGSTGKSVTFTSVFNIPYSYLPFKKLNRKDEKRFFSTVSLSIEVLKSGKDQPSEDLEELEPAARAFWSDTAFARTYDQSQSPKEYISGHLSVSLAPGTYNYVLQIKRGDETESRTSRTRSLTVTPYGEMKTGNIILGQQLMHEQQIPYLQLTGRGTEVTYGEDFYALAYLPNYDENAEHSLSVTRLAVSGKDTSGENRLYTQPLQADNIRTGLRPDVTAKDEKTYVRLDSTGNGFTYALLNIPNSNFPNALYRLTIKNEDTDRVVAESTFRSIWEDMPTSLLNLDVAIDMLHYILDKDKLRQLSEGSYAQREQKFRNFWEERDPTPKTEFNELMAEYYRRIDYAYENFTTENTLGYESDRGKVYINFGPPSNIDRKFPANEPTTEIWTYPNRQFVFRATTGFGDFKLVSD